MSVVLEKARPYAEVVKPKVNLQKEEELKERAFKLMEALHQKDTEEVQELISAWKKKSDFKKIEEKRLFFPETSQEYCHVDFLHWFCAYLHTKTGKYYALVFFEQDGAKGVFIQQADNLLDKNRQYVQSNDIVYDEDGIAYHVNYYENNGLHIILDRPDKDEFRVVQNLSAYSCTKPKKEKTDVADVQNAVPKPDIPFEPEYEISAETLEEDKSSFLSGLKDKVEDITLSIECSDYDYAAPLVTSLAGIGIISVEKYFYYGIVSTLADEEALATMTEQQKVNLQDMNDLLELFDPVCTILVMSVVVFSVLNIVYKKIRG